MSSIPNITLNDGNTMPALGFGTCHLNGRAGVASMVSAVQAGYRLLDSAFNYENEGALGQAVRDCGVPREELFLVSKLPGRHQRHDQAVFTVEESLFRAGLDYWDAYLVHWPNPGQGLYVEAWKTLIELRDAGLIRSIGVCNFLPEHMETLVNETGVAPAINQVEIHPFFPQDAQLAWDRANGVCTQAWSPLARINPAEADQVLKDLATKHGKSVPQIILRWHLERGTVAIPKTSSATRQRENLDVFDFHLHREDMEAMVTLARPDGRIKGQDPAVYEEF